MAGDWLSEKAIPGGFNGALRGVTAGSQRLACGRNAVAKLRGSLPDATDRRVLARIELPRPQDIVHFRKGSIAPANINDPSNRLIEKPPILSGLRVFVYTFSDRLNVFLSNGATKFWTCPDLAELSDRHVAVLHIYNEPHTEPSNPQQHSVDEFNLSARFLGLDVTISSPALGNMGEPIPGLLPGEPECLARRDELIQELLLKVRSGLRLGSGSGGCGSEVCAACDGEL